MTITADDEKELRKIIVRVQGKQYDDEETLSTVAERAYLLGRETAQKDIRRIAEVFGRMHEADGHAPFPASTDDLVRRAEELTRAENTRGDAIAALSEHRHAALLAAGVRGGPGAWRWAHDKRGTILDDAAAWERLLGEMRERAGRRAPVQGNLPRRGVGTIAWDEHVLAWSAYAVRYGRDQSAERIAERGGFGYAELRSLLGHEPETWAPVSE